VIEKVSKPILRLVGVAEGLPQTSHPTKLKIKEFQDTITITFNPSSYFLTPIKESQLEYVSIGDSESIISPLQN
jgi:hypothetical protein